MQMNCSHKSTIWFSLKFCHFSCLQRPGRRNLCSSEASKGLHSRFHIIPLSPVQLATGTWTSTVYPEQGCICCPQSCPTWLQLKEHHQCQSDQRRLWQTWKAQSEAQSDLQ